MAMHTEEASTLQLAPGEWPEQLTFGNQLYFRAAREYNSDRELVAVDYFARDTDDVLKVFND